jgi:hypothetical protein
VRNRQLKQDIPQKNADTKQSNAVTPGGQPVPASKRQPKRILGLMPNYRAVSGSCQAVLLRAEVPDRPAFVAGRLPGTREIRIERRFSFHQSRELSRVYCRTTVGVAKLLRPDLIRNLRESTSRQDGREDPPGQGSSPPDTKCHGNHSCYDPTSISVMVSCLGEKL